MVTLKGAIGTLVPIQDECEAGLSFFQICPNPAFDLLVTDLAKKKYADFMKNRALGGTKSRDRFLFCSTEHYCDFCPSLN